jgi:hypothetical protein
MRLVPLRTHEDTSAVRGLQMTFRQRAKGWLLAMQPIQPKQSLVHFAHERLQFLPQSISLNEVL